MNNLTHNSHTPPHSNKPKINNSKILLSTIAISILCSVSLEAGCPSNNAKLSGNTCTLNGASGTGFVFESQNRGTITGKTLIVGNSTINHGGQDQLYAATVNSGTVNNNKLEITKGSKVSSRYVGGARVSQRDGNATGNSLIISGAGTTLNRNGGLYHGARIYGGGILKDNNVTVKDGATVTTGHLSGAYSREGTALENNIVIDSATVKGRVYGAFMGFLQTKKNGIGNTATIKGDANVTGNVYGAGGILVEANKNKVTIEDNATVIGSVTGGKIADLA